MNKNHIIKAFKVSKATYDNFSKVAQEVGIKNTDLSRLLFNRALTQLVALGESEGWENISFTVRELN